LAALELMRLPESLYIREDRNPLVEMLEGLPIGYLILLSKK
jgi:hypothetical protein